MTYTFCALVMVKTSDPRLTDQAITRAMDSAGSLAALRRAVLQRLPKDITRLVAVLPVEEMKLLMMLHEAVGQDLTGAGFARPPPDYVPPTSD